MGGHPVRTVSEPGAHPGILRLVGALLLLGAAFTGPERAAAADAPPGRPTTARGWNELGTRHATEGNFEKALEAFSEAIRLAPNSSDLHVNRGLVHVRLKQWQPAEDAFTRATEANHEDTRAFLHRAIALAELDRNEEAFRDASRAARMEPDNPQTVFIRHYLCSRLGRHDLGHTAGATYIGIQGWEDEAAPYVALLNHIALRRAGDLKSAKDILAEAATLLPTQDWPYAVIVHLQGALDEASLLALATDNDKLTLARYYIGMRCWLEGDATTAKGHFEWVVASGNSAFLQHRLAKDHLREMAGADQAAASEE
ncbi:MAG TPA: hypothetical protein DCY13_14790 [Verrucomicrobiales bacterium]|nr:hypothetical protein [Verrucomicrobiales bacterium]